MVARARPRALKKFSVCDLVFGGGWTGRRLCLRDRARFITTSRTQEKLVELTALGIKAVQFDLMNDATWSNLPDKSDVEATIFTFEILSTQLSAFERLWNNHIASDRPVICLGTSSCFQGSDGYESVINETLPLTGLGVTGKSLEDRVKGEEWMLKNGATILHLTGIVGDEEVSDRKTGKVTPRTIRSFVSSGYFRNGLKLINAIHINDIYNIVLILIDKLRIERQEYVSEDSHGIRAIAGGERILASCGAFRVRDWVKELKLEPLPEILPPDVSMQGSKIVSIAKLSEFLPANYKWTLPLEGVEPVSQGLPTPDDEAHDKQWELMKSDFRGKWKGKTIWFKKDKGDERGGKMDHQAFIAEMNGSMLPEPDLVVKETQYHIYFLDADTGVWNGTGLAFAPNGVTRFPLTRKTFNESGRTFCFKGIGARCSLNTNEKKLGCELNFLYERSRSMIVSMYMLNEATGKLLLDSVGITTFRCAYGCNFALKPPQAEGKKNLSVYLKSLEGKSCRRQRLNNMRVFDTSDGVVCEYPTRAVLSFSDPDRVVQLFDDDLVCSIPSEVQAGHGCEMVLGCFHTMDYAQFVTVTYNSSGTLEHFTQEKWSN